MRKLLTLLLICAMPLIANQQEIDLLRATSKAFAHVANTAIPGVVNIKVQGTVEVASSNEMADEFFRQFFGITPQPQKTPMSGQGSGILVSHDGFILTNNHIVKDATEIVVQLDDGREFDATVIGTDPKTDLAVVKIDVEDLPFLRLGDSDAIDIGEWVIAIGSPLGLEATLTVGVVSAKGRNQLRITDFEDFIQTDAAINPGNSGGPLLNLDGEVIGINTAIATAHGGYMGIGFAIPSSIATNVMDQLIDSGSVSRGYLGIALQPIDNELAAVFGLDKPTGALVTEVMEGSPGAEGGIEQGDVILEVNETTITSASHLRNTIAMMEPGTVVDLTISRDGDHLTKKVTLGTRPGAQAEASTTVRKIGLEVTPLTEELARDLGLQKESGVVITSVEKGSPAAKAKLQPGTLILRVNRTAVTTPDEFIEAVETAREDSSRILLLVRQGQVKRFTTLQLD